MNASPELRAIPTDAMDLTIPWRVRCFEPNRALFLSRPEGWGASVARNIENAVHRGDAGRVLEAEMATTTIEGGKAACEAI